MAAPDKYAQWALLQESEPGLSRREYARRVDVSEAAVRLWEKGTIPKGGAEALRDLRSSQRGKLQATQAFERSAATAAVLLESTPEFRTAFDALLAQWAQQFPQHSLSLPIKRSPVLDLLRQMVDKLIAEGDFRGAVIACVQYLTQSRAEEVHQQERGAPDLYGVLFQAFADLSAQQAQGLTPADARAAAILRLGNARP